MRSLNFQNKYNNINKLAPGYLVGQNSGRSIGNSIGGSAASTNNFISIVAGENIKKGQVVQIDTNGTIKQCFVQNSQRNDNNSTLGIATNDTLAGAICTVQNSGVFNYSNIINITGPQLFCINNNSTTNVNVSDTYNETDNHIIKIGEMVSASSICINIEEYLIDE